MPTATCPPSHQSRLAADEIRLFHLPPDTFTSDVARIDNPPSGILRTFKRTEAPPYKAVSYVCGDPYGECRFPFQQPEDSTQAQAKTFPMRDAFIFCDEIRYPIYTNLYNAMMHFQKLEISGWLWMDCICINQSDNEEKALQIASMYQIYSAAHEVLVWLGHDTPEAHGAIWLVDNFESTRAQLKQVDASRTTLFTWGIDKFGDLAEIQNFREKVTSFALFCGNCRWFCRLWCHQELMLSTNPRIILGQSETTWKLWQTLWSWMGEIQLDARVALEMMEDKGQRDWFGAFKRMNQSDSLRDFQNIVSIFNIQPGQSFTTPHSRGQGLLFLFLTMARISRHTECSNSLDKLFGVLGIVDKFMGSEVVMEMSGQRPETAEALYFDLTSKVINETRSLDLLAFASGGSQAESPSLPTWVPNFNHSAHTSPLCFLHAETGKEHRFDAAGGLPTICDVKVIGQKISCTGLVFDSFEASSLMGETGSLLEMVKLCLRLDPLANKRSRLEILWRTYLTDMSKESGIPAPASLEKNFVTTFLASALQTEEPQQRFSEYLAMIRELQPDENAACYANLDWILLYFQPDFKRNASAASLSWLRHGAAEAQSLAAEWLFNSMTHIARNGRCLFATKKHLLGIGSDKAKPGDKLALLSNAHAPFILRPTALANHYEVVGDCFILDRMHGEVLETEPLLKDRAEEIWIV